MPARHAQATRLSLFWLLVTICCSRAVARAASICSEGHWARSPFSIVSNQSIGRPGHRPARRRRRRFESRRRWSTKSLVLMPKPIAAAATTSSGVAIVLFMPQRIPSQLCQVFLASRFRAQLLRPRPDCLSVAAGLEIGQTGRRIWIEGTPGRDRTSFGLDSNRIGSSRRRCDGAVRASYDVAIMLALRHPLGAPRPQAGQAGTPARDLPPPARNMESRIPDSILDCIPLLNNQSRSLVSANSEQPLRDVVVQPPLPCCSTPD